MNILFTYPTLFNPMVGGAERVTDLLARALSARGHNVFYLNNKPDKALSSFNSPGCQAYFPYKDYKDKRNIPFYTDYLLKNDIDIIVNQCGAFRDSILYNFRDNTNAKVVSVIHMMPYQNYDHLFSEISVLKNRSLTERIKRLARIVIYPKIKRDYHLRLQSHYTWLGAENNTDSIVVLSESFKDDLFRLAPNMNSSLITSIANPLSYTIERGLPKNKTILYVGRLDTCQKRVDRLIRIWKKISCDMPEWNLKIIGDGPDKKKLEYMSRRLDRISFLGFQNPEPYYREASILCMTSNHEGFGMVLIEAMSKGCLPIAFDSFSSIHDIIKDPRQLVRPFSIKEYTNKLMTLMTDEQLRSSLVNSCYSNVENFKIDHIVNQWENLFFTLKNNK